MVAADLHAELIFEELKRNKNLFLIILIRNPIESVTVLILERLPKYLQLLKKINLYLTLLETYLLYSKYFGR